MTRPLTGRLAGNVDSWVTGFLAGHRGGHVAGPGPSFAEEDHQPTSSSPRVEAEVPSPLQHISRSSSRGAHLRPQQVRSRVADR